MIEDKIHEFEKHCEKIYKHIEELAKSHNVSFFVFFVFFCSRVAR